MLKFGVRANKKHFITLIVVLIYTEIIIVCETFKLEKNADKLHLTLFSRDLS